MIKRSSVCIRRCGHLIPDSLSRLLGRWHPVDAPRWRSESHTREYQYGEKTAGHRSLGDMTSQQPVLAQVVVTQDHLAVHRYVVGFEEHPITPRNGVFSVVMSRQGKPLSKHAILPCSL